MKKILRSILALVLAVGVAAALCYVSVSKYSRGRLYDDSSVVPHNHAALVLGTSPNGRNGGPNLFFQARINACVELFNEGKIDRIIVSGDNRHVSYNEPRAMRQALINKGIPAEVIFLDYAGFRTLDSVVRAREVFGQSSFTVISQKFHNERALFIAGQKGIDAIGFNAEDVGSYYGFLTHAREVLARFKVYLDLIFDTQPHFLGEPVDIG